MTRIELVTKYPELIAYLMGIGRVELFPANGEQFSTDFTLRDSEHSNYSEVINEPVDSLVFVSDRISAEELKHITDHGFQFRGVQAETIGYTLAMFGLPTESDTMASGLTDSTYEKPEEEDKGHFLGSS
ncbi:hypothetical protein [Fibrella forsythiae]|uniref:Uncharacterized protein n=1 Tax=Fibrella forsythiae TaxID=2817061 RepID=A0ABS3JMF7_9BACT|nr:hypothetical protein [Fibrella forsythiae]MBO0951189.1 hypothetical protein [Fibrella forsythiae]